MYFSGVSFVLLFGVSRRRLLNRSIKVHVWIHQYLVLHSKSRFVKVAADFGRTWKKPNNFICGNHEILFPKPTKVLNGFFTDGLFF